MVTQASGCRWVEDHVRTWAAREARRRGCGAWGQVDELRAHQQQLCPVQPQTVTASEADSAALISRAVLLVDTHCRDTLLSLLEHPCTLFLMPPPRPASLIGLRVTSSLLSY